MKNILFYKYVEIKNPLQLKEKQLELCEELNLLGTVLLAEEGINGCLSGKGEDTDRYKQELKSDKRFSDVEFKEGLVEDHTFKRLSVRIRKEIVTSNLDTDMGNKADYIEPKELKKLLDSGEDLILVDIRNSYEYNIGRFKNAVEMPMDVHREFPQALKKIENKKDCKIVTYCTGGVRCEKSTAYMKDQGFENIRQLHGGIINYGKECGNEHWEGKCFVFDTRGAIDIDPKNHAELVSQCTLCNIPSADYHNCAVVECDERFIACEKCIKVLDGCCSKNCRNSNKRKIEVTL
ncbi:rhodanese-related sulfurtransferase [Candidatus Woesearchaeota archaeon]|nr:rhodanese-related sulfurtransferase [Candidatus Woesearchaeota archaeon]